MKKFISLAFILVLSLSLVACRANTPEDTEPSTDTQATTAATTPTILPDPTVETNIPDPSVDTSIPMLDDFTDGDDGQVVG